jgi:hypothetical protein
MVDDVKMIWTCELCGQAAVSHTASGALTVQPGFYGHCMLRDHMIGNECIAYRQLEEARKMVNAKGGQFA